MRAPERDYSHRSLLEKLGVTPDSLVALSGRHDDWLIALLEAHLEQRPAARLTGSYDLVFLRVDAARDLAAIARIVPRLEAAGALWIVHPKGRGAQPRDSEVRAAAIAAGLVDNKISAYGETHTATRYVIPKLRRKSHGGKKAPV